jgi:ubiquitin C-terminal hydrolase
MTVPVDVLPAARFVETSTMLEIPVSVDGPAGELELLQCIVVNARTSVANRTTLGLKAMKVTEVSPAQLCCKRRARQCEQPRLSDRWRVPCCAAHRG